jgi:SAM-dependent methyltransferase
MFERIQRLVLRLPNRMRAFVAPEKKTSTMHVDRVATLAAYLLRAKKVAAEHARRTELERQLASGQQTFLTPGICFVCSKAVSFETDFLFSGEPINGIKLPNWRERVICPSCGLNNRMRASIQILEDVLCAKRNARVYLGEHVTQFYAKLAQRYDHLIGSEYLGNKVAFGSVDANGTRNESITRLTFEAASFDFVLSFDVLEHIPDPEEGVREIFRVLAPGGKVMLSVPFLIWEQSTQTRAVIAADGSIRHVLTPQYHGDPLSLEGCLCFQDFGWELLDQMRAAGFVNVQMLLYWSDELGYYGIEQCLIVGEKPA